MGDARYVGRVGALAVALGIGVAVANTPGFAWADGDEGSSSDSSASSSGPNSGADSGSDSGSDKSSASNSPSSTPEPPADSEDADSEDEEESETPDSEDASDLDGSQSAEAPTPKKKAAERRSSKREATPEPKSQIRIQSADISAVTESSAPENSAPQKTDSQPSQLPVATVSETPVSTMAALPSSDVLNVEAPAEAPEPAQTTTAGVLTALGLSPLAGGGPSDVPESPIAWTVFAALRREGDQQAGAEQQLMSVADPTTATLTVNSAPSAAPTVGYPDTATGTVTGAMNATDPDGNSLTYSVQSKTAAATVSIDAVGNFTYTPSEAMRLQAATTSGLDTDTFTVRVSDGQTFTDVPVTVTVRPSQLVSSAPVDVGRDPSGVTFNADGSRAYVTNQYDKTVSVVDTSNGSVLATIKVPYAPKAVVVSPVAGQNRAYVAMSSGVAVIDTATNTVVDLNPATKTIDVIKVGSGPTAIAINPTGTRLYVSNGSSSTVSVINTATNLEIARVSVGSQPSGLAVSPDGTRVYALSRGTDKLTVFRTSDNTVIGSAKVGDSPRSIVLSPNGQTAYVSNYNSGTVTVLDTTASTPTLVKTITVGTQPEGVAMSADGTVVYVANGRDTVSVISTATNAVASTVTIDSPAESGAHAIAVAGGKLYVTDYVDDWVRVLNVAPLMTPPQSLGPATVGTPDEATGAVSGDLRVVDTDGDPLSYSVITAPTKGTVAISPNGTYTYTPTALARQQAGPNTTDTFTVRAGDGTYTKEVTVTVPIKPLTVGSIPVTVSAINTSQPTAIGVDATNVYVFANGSVSVIDRTSNTVTETTSVSDEPPTVFGNRRYVANNVYSQTGMNVDVFDTTTGTLITSVHIPNCDECTYAAWGQIDEMVLSPDGTRLYVRHNYYTETGGTSAVSMVDTTTDTYQYTVVTNLVGDIDVAPDGRLYAGDQDFWWPDVYVFDRDLNYIDVIRTTPLVGSLSLVQSIGINASGTRAYVDVQDWDAPGFARSYSVIDTATNSEVAVVNGATTAVTPDGARRYELQSDGKTVNVYDNATNALLGTFVTDQNATTGTRSIAVAADGNVYVADAADNKVYAVTVGAIPSGM